MGWPRTSTRLCTSLGVSRPRNNPEHLQTTARHYLYPVYMYLSPHCHKIVSTRGPYLNPIHMYLSPHCHDSVYQRRAFTDKEKVCQKQVRKAHLSAAHSTP